MSTLNLYRVTVTQEWSAEAEALVWAPDKDSARRLAQKWVELDIEEAESGFCRSSARPEPLDPGVMDRMNDDDLWLILPNGDICANNRAGLAKFQALLDPDRLEALRLARIEAGNGQLKLLEAQP